MPLHEALRTCQVSPAGEWQPAAYQFIGRDDLAENGATTSETLFTSGYRTTKDFIVRHGCSALILVVSYVRFI